MKRFLAGLLILGFALPTFAANHYVRAAAAGTASGSDWTDAFTALPATLVRGDTYYVADGTYGPYFFAPVTGTTLITVKYATVADHGTSTGWSNGYTGTTALWTRSTAGVTWRLGCSYLSISGLNPASSASAWSTTQRGFTVTNTSTSGSSSNFTIYKINGDTASNLTVDNVEVAQTYGGNIEGGAVFFNDFSGGSTNVTFQHCYFSGAGQTWFKTLNTTNVDLNYCYFANCGSNGSSFHSAGIIPGGTTAINFTLRNFMMQDLLYTVGSSVYIEPQATGGSGLHIYSGVIRSVSADEYSPNGILLLSGGDVWGAVDISNVTVYGLKGPVSGINGTVNATGWTCKNVVWQSCVATPTITGCTDTTNIKNTGGVSFVNAGAGNFGLTVNTSAGTTLSAPYTLDPDGTIRGSNGVWCIGAFQYPLGVTPPTAPSGLIVTPVSNTSLTTTWTDTSGGSATSFIVQRSAHSAGVFTTVGTPSSATFTDTGLTASTTYDYKVAASNAGGNSSYTSIVSGTTTVAAGAPIITLDPVTQSVLSSTNVAFTVTASGSPTPTWQWKKDGVDIGGATTAVLALFGVTTGDNGSYTAVATNASGSATSAAAILTVTSTIANPKPVHSKGGKRR